MKIAIIGAGAMGLLYGGYLSQENETYLVCTNQPKADAINENGVIITEKDGSCQSYHPKAVVESEGLGEMDLVILFVKAMASRVALEANRGLIGDNTILMTLQNGAGHESLLMEFAKPEHVVVGVSQDGSFLSSFHEVIHSGKGTTFFGKIDGDSGVLAPLAENFCRCGFHSENSDNIKHFIWSKLMINASSSVLSGVFGMPQGYCYDDPSAWEITQQLMTEMVAVAEADGVTLDLEEQIERMRTHLTVNREGCPSLYVDLRDGRLTEVDTISGSVVRAGLRLGVPTPTHSLVVQVVHGLERRPQWNR